MKYVASSFILTILFYVASNSFSAEKVKVDPRVQQQVQLLGKTRVFVRLNVPNDDKGTSESRNAQLKAIAATQLAVLNQLEGTDYKLTRKPSLSPILAMEIGAVALTVLERSSYIQRVDDVPKLTNPTENVVIHPEK